MRGTGVAIKVIANNRKAYHDYTILKSVEAGLVLTGTEIKSIRDGKVNLREAFARDDKGKSGSSTLISRPSPGATAGTTTLCGHASCYCTRTKLETLPATSPKRG